MSLKETSEGTTGVESTDALNDLEKMSLPIHFQPQPITKKAKILDLFKLIPGLSEIFDRINDAGENFSALMQLKENFAAGANVAQASFHGLGLGLAILDFIRIPAIFLAAALLGQKVPVTLSKTGQWAYAGAMVALAALMIALPGAIPIITVITAGFILGNAVFTLGRLLYQRHQLKKDLKNIAEHIHEETENLNKLQLKAQSLRTQLEQATENEKANLLKEYITLKAEYANRCKSLQALYDKKEIFTYKLAKRDHLAVVDKVTAVLLSAGILVGAAVAIAFPPIGFAVAAACAAAGIVYLVSRIAIPFLAKKLGFNTKKVSEKEISKHDNKDNFKDYQDNFKLEELNSQSRLDKDNDKVLKDSEVEVNKLIDESSHANYDSEAVMELGLGMMPGTAHPNSSLNEYPIDKSVLTLPSFDKADTTNNQKMSVPLKNEEEDDEGDGEREGRPDDIQLS
ncbi:hypothetical protein ACNVED_14100 [Legionella sp. D16C41]|uniref:hypothetical protein n=1 Tax=Legionella sp. D16C41 TaxID=3402688 RepID=UPI003AF6DC20